MSDLKEYIDTYRVQIIAFILFVILVLCLLMYKIKQNTYISAEFKNLRPSHKKLDVFYKGFKVGRTDGIKPDKEYKYTVVRIVINAPELKLPIDVTAKLMHGIEGRKEYDYIDMVIPEKPSMYLLKNGDMIAGETSIGVESFLASQNPDTLENIKDNLAEATINLNETIVVLNNLFTILTDVVQENRPNILSATANIRESTKNLKETSANLNYVINRKKLESTVINIDTSSVNTKETTKNLQKLTQDIDKIAKDVDKMLPKVDCVVDETYSVLRNANEITCDVSKALKKRFGGMRLLFGKSDCDCSKPSCPCLKTQKPHR